MPRDNHTLFMVNVLIPPACLKLITGHRGGAIRVRDRFYEKGLAPHKRPPALAEIGKITGLRANPKQKQRRTQHVQGEL